MSIELITEFANALDQLPEDKKGSSKENQAVQRYAQRILDTFKAESLNLPKANPYLASIAVFHAVQRIQAKFEQIAQKGGFKRCLFESNTEKLSQKAIDFLQKKMEWLINYPLREGSSEAARNLFGHGSKNRTQEFVQEAFAINDLAHLNEIQNNPNSPIFYEGTHARRWFKKIASLLQDLPTKLFAGIDLIKYSAIKAAFEKGAEAIDSPERSSDSLAARINQGELVILSSGYKGHSTTVIFYNKRMIVCDRSQSAAASFTAYSIKKAVDPTKVAMLIGLRNQEQPHAEQNLNNFITNHTETERNNPIIQQIEKISPPSQTVGNCDFASVEGAFLAAYALLELDDAKQQDLKSKLKAPHLTKEVFNFLRLKKLEEFLTKHSEVTDSYLVRNCLEYTFLKCDRLTLDRWDVKKLFPRVTAAVRHFYEYQKAKQAS